MHFNRAKQPKDMKMVVWQILGSCPSTVQKKMFDSVVTPTLINGIPPLCAATRDRMIPLNDDTCSEIRFIMSCNATAVWDDRCKDRRIILEKNTSLCDPSCVHPVKLCLVPVQKYRQFWPQPSRRLATNMGYNKGCFVILLLFFLPWKLFMCVLNVTKRKHLLKQHIIQDFHSVNSNRFVFIFLYVLLWFMNQMLLFIGAVATNVLSYCQNSLSRSWRWRWR